MTSLAGMSYCTLFDTGERRINFRRERSLTRLKSAEPRSEEPRLTTFVGSVTPTSMEQYDSCTDHPPGFTSSTKPKGPPTDQVRRLRLVAGACNHPNAPSTSREPLAALSEQSSFEIVGTPFLPTGRSRQLRGLEGFCSFVRERKGFRIRLGCRSAGKW